MRLNELRDFAVIMVNGRRVGELDRRHNQDSITLKLPDGKATLDILVENLGRINFGPYLLKNKKGITKQVLFNGKEIYEWNMYRLPFHSLNGIKYGQSGNYVAPVLKKGFFSLNKVGDTYLDMSNWGKGVVWINGHNLGRYWQVGPQQTVYVPQEWLKAKNEVVV